MASTGLLPGNKLVGLLMRDSRFSQEEKKLKPNTSKPRPKSVTIEEDEHKNPFSLTIDQNWINLKKTEKIKRSENGGKVHQRHTLSTRVPRAAFPSIRKTLKSFDDEDSKELFSQQKTVLGVRKCRPLPVEREFTHDFIQKKRDIFLTEFALLMRRQEVEKHKSMALELEAKFARRVQRLHDDAVLFDDFLKATDDDAVRKMKIAERETKLKLEKVAEYKRLLSSVISLKSEIAKKAEVLSEYLNYKAFLNHVFENNKHSRSLSSRTNRLVPIENTIANEKQMVGKRQEVCIVGKCKGQNDESAFLPFQSPLELQDIIRNLEENNLKLIYKFQQTEEELDDLKKYAKRSAARLGRETVQLAEHVTLVKANIDKYEERAEELRVMHRILSEGSRERDSKQALAELKGNIEMVYGSTLNTSVVAMDSLAMLTCIEQRMDDLLEEIESFPIAAIQEVQRSIDKDRRRQLREEKLTMQKLKQEERARRATERANSISFKRTGKPLMFRSAPPRAKNTAALKLMTTAASEESLDYFLKE